MRRTREKNKTRKGDGEERRAWVGLPLKLRWLDLWVSGGRPVQTERTARAEALQEGQQAGGRPRCSAWSEQGLYPQSQDCGLTFTSLTSCQYLVPVTRHRHECPPSEAHGYLMSPLILCCTLRIWHNLLWCFAKEFHCIHRFAVLTL